VYVGKVLGKNIPSGSWDLLVTLCQAELVSAPPSSSLITLLRSFDLWTSGLTGEVYF